MTNQKNSNTSNILYNNNKREKYEKYLKIFHNTFSSLL